MPYFLPGESLSRSCHFGHVGLRNTHHSVASLDLLCDQGFRGGHEDHLAGREPPVEIVHDHGGNKGLSQAGRQTHQRVAEQRGPSNVQLVVPHWAISRVNPQGAR